MNGIVSSLIILRRRAGRRLRSFNDVCQKVLPESRHIFIGLCLDRTVR